MTQKIQKIAVFCGAKNGKNSHYTQAAMALAKVMAEANITLVYGGGKVGLMGTLADAILQLGGKAIGVIPQTLVDKEIAHPNLTEQHIVDTMHQRKALMAQMSDGFIALPGGIGTLDELFEIISWAQLGFHNKPIGIFNIANYYTGLLDFLDHATAEELVPVAQRNKIIVAATAEKLLEEVMNYSNVPFDRWNN